MTNPGKAPIPTCTDCGSDEFVSVELSEEERAEGLSYTICSECGTSYFLKVYPREKADITLQNINRLRRYCDKPPIEVWKSRGTDIIRN